MLREEDKWDKEMRGWEKKKKNIGKKVCDEYFCFWRFFWGLRLYRVIKGYLEENVERIDLLYLYLLFEILRKKNNKKRD